MTRPKTSKPNLSKADRKRLKELRSQRRDAARNFYHPAIWYGAEPCTDEASIIAEERARIDAEIKRLTAPPPVLEGVIVRPDQGALW
ncbi:hypothetical protein [Actinomadura sp. 9N215]|uniref:hypothetical protein n=1 Tax=Actinomadura sp. 9N215 TaxID=3375150 RepID=UPI003787B33E